MNVLLLKLLPSEVKFLWLRGTAKCWCPLDAKWLIKMYDSTHKPVFPKKNMLACVHLINLKCPFQMGGKIGSTRFHFWVFYKKKFLKQTLPVPFKIKDHKNKKSVLVKRLFLKTLTGPKNH